MTGIPWGLIFVVGALLIFAVTVVLTGVRGRRDGKNDQRAKELQDDADAVRTAKQAEAGVARLSDDAVAERLRQWQR